MAEAASRPRQTPRADAVVSRWNRGKVLVWSPTGVVCGRRKSTRGPSRHLRAMMQMNQIARSFPDFCFWIQPCLLCLQRARVAAKHSAKHAHTLPPSPNANPGRGSIPPAGSSTPGNPTSQGLTPNVPPSSKYLCFSRQSGVDYSDKIYGRSFQNSPPIRSQCKTVTRVNGLFFFPLPLSFSSDLSSSLETLSSRVSRRRHQVANHSTSSRTMTLPFRIRSWTSL